MSFIETVVSSALGAGIVTFALNFWKAYLDFRKAKIEELYAAVHKYTSEMPLMTAGIRTGNITPDSRSRLFATEDSHRISLLIDLYFPRLRLTFKEFTIAIEEFIFQHGKFRTDEKEFNEDKFRIDILRIESIGKKLKQEVVDLSRQGSLLALIEAVQDYDQQHRS